MISKNQIKEVNALHLKKFRDEENLFIAEGVKIVNEILESHPKSIHQLFVTEEYLKAHYLALRKHNLSCTTVTEDELKKISLQTQPNKALAVCKYFDHGKPGIDLAKQFSFYLDDIRDPGNLGTILRMADWFGISEIFCSKQSTELYNPKTIQASMGAFLRVKLYYGDIKEVIADKKIPVYGAVLNGENIYSQKLQNGLIIIGNEANGIAKENLSLITHPITIPAAATNKSESLNAAMATAIICSEFFRRSI
jgi:RNA methyltransferase, TrmH family